MDTVKKYHFKTGSLLHGLDSVFKRNVRRLEFKKGEYIFRMGTQPRGVFFLKRGRVKIFHTTADGDNHIVYIYSKGEPFGYRPILCEELHPVSAQTLEKCVVSFLPKKDFLDALRVSTELSNKLLRNLSYEFGVWTNKLTFFAQRNLRERIALSLLILSEKYKKSPSKTHPWITLSREDLADFVGTSVEPLVRMLRTFKDEELIRSKGRALRVVNSHQLLRLIRI